MDHAAVAPFNHSTLVRRVRSRARAQAQVGPAQQVSSDIRLFATTFGAGFLFVSLFLA